jgi:hypothetical protein
VVSKPQSVERSLRDSAPGTVSRPHAMLRGLNWLSRQHNSLYLIL